MNQIREFSSPISLFDGSANQIITKIQAICTTMVASSDIKITLPRFGLGMAALGRPGYINLNRNSIFGEDNDRSVEKMQNRSNLVMDKLFEITSGSSDTTIQLPWFDCARSYGLSEKFVGEYLRSKNVSAEDVYVSSKWGYTYVADWKVSLEEKMPHEIKDHSVENFLKQIKETDELIGEYVNLYQIHSATFESGVLTDKRVHDALTKCKVERGWNIGLSLSGPKQCDILREAMKIVQSSTSDEKDRGEKLLPLFDSVQCTYNVFEQRPGEALLEAHRSGMDIIIKEGLANGRVLRGGSKVLEEFAKQLACEPDQLALAFILAQPFEPRVLSGAVTPQQLESNSKAVRVSETLKDNPKLLREIAEACVMDSEEYWSERSTLSWN